MSLFLVRRWKHHKVEIPIPLHGWLEWFNQFSKREAEKGIYVPLYAVLSMQNFMGVKWLTGSIPDMLYDQYSKMKTAIQVDLQFYLAKNPAQL